MELLANAQDSILEKAEHNDIPRKPLPRKPLPETTRSPPVISHGDEVVQQGASLGVDSSTAVNSTTEDKPLLPSRPSNISIQAPSQANGRVQRKPLGPRPLVTRSGGRKPLPGDEEQHSNSNSNTDTSRTSEFPSYNSEPSVFPNVDRPKSPSKRFSITIIRRDPSSGAQWNVGTLVGEEQTESISPVSRRQYFDISIHLSTPGYGQFKHSPLSQVYDKSRIGVGKSSPAPNLLSVPNNKTAKSCDPATSGPGFVRQLCMEGSSFWTRTRQHKRSQSDTTGKGSTTGGINNNAVRGSQDEPFRDHDIEGPSDSEPKGYVFTSPWGGRCKFSTGSSGKNLRCRHILPSPISANTGGEFASPSQESTIVSELRFNLPSTAAIFSPHAPSNAAKTLVIESGRLSKHKLGHIRNKLSPEKIVRPALPPRLHPTSYAALYPSDEDGPPMLPPRPHLDATTPESSDDGETHASPVPEQLASPLPNEDESRLDLSIGQEKAGGGNRGKNAKLGKLVIYDEGFKMLDLIVAANMGVWWSVWGSDG